MHTIVYVLLVTVGLITSGLELSREHTVVGLNLPTDEEHQDPLCRHLVKQDRVQPAPPCSLCSLRKLISQASLPSMTTSFTQPPSVQFSPLPRTTPLLFELKSPVNRGPPVTSIIESL